MCDLWMCGGHAPRQLRGCNLQLDIYPRRKPLYNSEDDHLCAVLHLIKSIFQTPSAKITGLCRSERGLCRYMVDCFGFSLELWPEICDPDESNKLNIWIRSKNSSINLLEWFVKDGEHNGLDYRRFANLCGHVHIFWRHIEVQRYLLRAILEWIEISLPMDDSEVEDCDVVQKQLCWPCLIKAFADDGEAALMWCCTVCKMDI